MPAWHEHLKPFAKTLNVEILHSQSASCWCKFKFCKPAKMMLRNRALRLTAPRLHPTQRVLFFMKVFTNIFAFGLMRFSHECFSHSRPFDSILIHRMWHCCISQSNNLPSSLCTWTSGAPCVPACLFCFLTQSWNVNQLIQVAVKYYHMRRVYNSCKPVLKDWR